MYSLEKLARGKNGGILKEGSVGHIEIAHNLDAFSRKRSSFGNPNMFFVVTEKDPKRPVGKLYSSSMETEEVHK